MHIQFARKPNTVEVERVEKIMRCMAPFHKFSFNLPPMYIASMIVLLAPYRFF